MSVHVCVCTCALVCDHNDDETALSLGGERKRGEERVEGGNSPWVTHGSYVVLTTTLQRGAAVPIPQLGLGARATHRPGLLCAPPGAHCIPGTGVSWEPPQTAHFPDRPSPAPGHLRICLEVEANACSQAFLAIRRANRKTQARILSFGNKWEVGV